MYFVYANKEGYRFGDDPRDNTKYRDNYREYYFMSESVEAASNYATKRTLETGEGHFVRKLMSWPSRLAFTVENGEPFRPYAHNGNGEQDL